MAIERPGNTGSQNPPTNTQLSDALRNAQAQQAQQSRAAQQGPQVRRARSSIMDINTRTRTPMTRASTSETVLGFQKALTKSFDAGITPQMREQFQLHVMDSHSALIALSTLIATYVERDSSGQVHVAVYSMVVEASGGKLPSRYINIGNTPVEIEQVPGDTVNKELWDKTILFLRDVFGPQAQYHNAGAMVLPSELQPEDEIHIRNVSYMVTQALFTVMEHEVTGTMEPISVSMVDNGANVSASLDYNPADIENAVGLPLRSNLAVTMRASLSNGAQTSLHEQVLDLTRVDGYIDLIYVKPSAPAWGQPQQTQHYYPRYVITRLDSQVNLITLELQLLALSSAVLVGRNMAWSSVFLPRYNVGEKDLRDIGAIGYEVNLTGDPNAQPARIPTKSESFGRRELYNLITAAIVDSVVYSLDVEETGPLAWITQTFIAAANGDQLAYQAIVEAANNLTDGHFGRMWNNGAIAQDDYNRIHLGYYIDHSGKRCDLRDLDYLAMLNLFGDRDMQAFHEWAATFEDANIPLEIRLEKRMKIMRALLPDLRLKGYARRITFTADFIATLEAAIQAAGLVVRPNNVQIIEGPSVHRGTFNAQQFAVSPQVGAGLFNYQAPNQFGGFRGGLNQPFFGRYGQ